MACLHPAGLSNFGIGLNAIRAKLQVGGVFLGCELDYSLTMNNEIQKQVPYAVSEPRYSVSHAMVTTAFDIPGFRVLHNLGVVRGIVVRSRSIVANIGASLQTLVGGNITAWTRLCEETRAEAFEIMIRHATEIGANAIIGARYDATEIATGATEVLAYGTAVVVEQIEGSTIYDS